MTAALVAGLLAGYGVALPVGAVATYLVGLAARTGGRTAAAAALGVATADGLYALAAVLGGAAAARLVTPVAGPLRVVCAVVLLTLSAATLRQALAPVPDRLPAVPSPRRAYARLLAVTLVNPTTVLYFAALVVGARAGTAATPAQQAVFVLGATAASASWQLLLAGGRTLLGRVVTGLRGRLATAAVSAPVVAVLAVRLALAR